MKIKLVLLSAAALLGMSTTMLPAQADPRHDGPRPSYQGQDGRHKYVYYPNRQVYYAPDSSTWFWLNGGNWQFGATLPAQHRVSAGDGLQIVLQSGRPYTQHVYVEENYGRPWRVKHKHRDYHGRRAYRHERQDQHYRHQDKHGNKHGRRHGRDRDDDH